MSSLAGLSLRELTAALAKGDCTAEAVFADCLTRAEAANPTNKAFITLCDEPGAADIDRQAATAPLYGAPFAVKDLFDVAGLATTCGSASRRDQMASKDAAAVSSLKAAGGLLLGKTNLHEFAYGATGVNETFGTCPNPHDPGRLAGGSSSGSAVAVAEGLVPFALGSDTGGSVRAPAALCGLVGYKPSYGRIGTEGMVPFSWSCDHVGLFTRDVGDAALVFQALQDPRTDGPSAEPSDISGLRVGVSPALIEQKCDPEIRAAVEVLLGRLEAEGAALIAIDLPDLALGREAALTIQMAEAFSYQRPFLEERGELYSEEFRAGLAVGQFLLAEHYINAQRLIRKYRQETAAAFRAIDLLVTPGCPIVAPEFDQPFVDLEGERTPVGNAATRYTSFFNQTGQPAIALPFGRHSSGLPMSVQLVGKAGRDEALLSAARAVEAVIEGSS